MTDQEAIEMMQRASAEIKELRRHIEMLAPKAAAYDNIAAILGLLPRPSDVMSMDVAWLFDNRIAELKAAELKASETASS